MVARIKLVGAVMAMIAFGANAQQQAPQQAAPESESERILPQLEGTATTEARLTGGVRATATLSDNINLSSEAGSSGATFEIGPYVRYAVNRPRFQADLYYSPRYFTTNGDLGNKGLRHDLRSKLRTALWKETFWLSGRASVAEVVIDPVNANSVDPARQSGSRSTVQRYALAPYFSGFLNDRNTSYVAGYGASFSKNSSRTEAQITQKLIGNVTRDTRARGVGWLLESEMSNSTFESSDAEYDSTRLTMEALLRPNGKLRTGVGVEYNKVTALRNENGEDSGWAPTLSVLWTPNPRTSLSARYSKPYFGSSGSALLSYQPSRWAFGLEYSYGLTDNTSGPLASADIRNSLATGQRPGGESGVVSQLLADGVLPEFDEAVIDGFVAGAISRTRRLNLTAGWTGRRTSVGISASRFRSESQPLAFDLPITPGAPNGLLQTSLSLAVTRRVDARSNAQVRLATTVSESADQSVKSQLDVITLTWLRQVTKKADVSASYRFATQRARLGQTTRYREHAIVLGVNYRF